MKTGISLAVDAPLVRLQDPAAEIERIAVRIREIVGQVLGRRGLVVAISGGIDSAVCAALGVRALGPSRVFGLLLPERDSSPESTRLGRAVAEHLGIEYLVEPIEAMLAASGCYQARDAAISRSIPGFGPGWGVKIVTPSGLLETDQLNVPSLVVKSPEGVVSRARLTPQVYREIVAATNFKQRIRKMREYYHADRLHYAVMGTPNRLEYDQGFFVKGGDGLADLKPIAHLFKTQVYQLGAELGVPDEILARTPTTDTFSLAQTQEEFFFGLPLDQLDELLYAETQGWSAEETAARLGLGVEAVTRVWRDLAGKRAATRYLHLPAQSVEPA